MGPRGPHGSRTTTWWWWAKALGGEAPLQAETLMGLRAHGGEAAAAAKGRIPPPMRIRPTTTKWWCSCHVGP